MNSVPRIALGLALALGGSLAAAPIAAQTQGGQVSALNKQERAALQALKTAIEAKDYVAAEGALPAAQSAAQSGYGRYLASALQLRLGLETKNYGLQSSAIDAMVTSGAAPAAALPELYKNQGALAVSAGQPEKAEQAFTRWTEVAPNDTDALLSLAEIKAARKKVAEEVALIDRAIKARKAAGQPVPEAWYKRGLKQAFDAKLAPATVAFSHDLVAAYPTADNWRDALLILRDLAPQDQAATLDLLRLLRGAKAMGGDRDYYQLAEALTKAGLGAEAKAVLDEGIAAKMVDPAQGQVKDLLASAKRRATSAAALKTLESKAASAPSGAAAMEAADAFFGHGEYAKAAALYRSAIQKGSVDTDLANSRLGMALALAGQKAEAETALRAVAGARTNLASLWLIWLGQRG
ncbi:hypothetical protein [Allosphingosinicella humi]